ncbi:MAG: hypothetical protein JRN62_04285 [Nitrososphaerota archaeon]|nr:hypothetical protein [Nitrososphaerota archaeon]MDG6948822.1 hypothetical protein [Nitrososphaerota archaeon]
MPAFSESRIVLRFAKDNEHTAAAARKQDVLRKRVMEMSPAIDGSLDFMNTAERQSGNSFEINISLSNFRTGKHYKDLELYYLNLSFADVLKHGPGEAQKKRAVAIELRYMDDSCIADVSMPLSRHITELPALP